MNKAVISLASDSRRNVQKLPETPSRLPAVPAPAAGVAVALNPLSRLSTYQALATQTASRQLHAWQGLWGLALQPQRCVSLWTDSLAIQAAVMQRLVTQQTQLLQGLASIGSEIGGLKRVNTLAKLVDQETDISARLHALMSDQMTATAELVESVQVGFGYLVEQKESGN